MQRDELLPHDSNRSAALTKQSLSSPRKSILSPGPGSTPSGRRDSRLARRGGGQQVCFPKIFYKFPRLFFESGKWVSFCPCFVLSCLDKRGDIFLKVGKMSKKKVKPKPKQNKPKPYNSLGKKRMYDGSGNGGVCYPDYPIYADDRN